MRTVLEMTRIGKLVIVTIGLGLVGFSTHDSYVLDHVHILQHCGLSRYRIGHTFAGHILRTPTV